MGEAGVEIIFETAIFSNVIIKVKFKFDAVI